MLQEILLGVLNQAIHEMSIAVHDHKQIDEFFAVVEPLKEAYQNDSFRYLAVRHKNTFVLVRATVAFNVGASDVPFTHFESPNVRAGHYRLSELQVSARDLVNALLSGSLPTPHGELNFPASSSGGHSTSYIPFHPAGLQQQNRINVLNLFGSDLLQYLRQPFLDWELRAASTPYDGLQELMFEYHLGVLPGDFIGIEVIAFNVAAIDAGSAVSGTEARLAVRIASGLSTEKATLGYRIVSQGRVVARSVLTGNSLKWTQVDGHLRGSAEIDVPNAAVLHCFASYDGIAQHHWLLFDPSTAQNARRAAYEAFDGDLSILNDFIAKPEGRSRNARDLEAGVAWLLWMLGFSVAHLGGTQRTQDAADLIATTPLGHFAVIECTTGLLKTDNKLPLLIARAESVRSRLEASNNLHLRVVPVMVTSKTRAEVAADLEQAEKLGVLVLTREALVRAVGRTPVLPNADQLSEQAEDAIRSARAKYEAQGTLPLPSQ